MSLQLCCIDMLLLKALDLRRPCSLNAVIFCRCARALVLILYQIFGPPPPSFARVINSWLLSSLLFFCTLEIATLLNAFGSLCLTTAYCSVLSVGSLRFSKERTPKRNHRETSRQVGSPCPCERINVHETFSVFATALHSTITPQVEMISSAAGQ